MPPPSPLDRKPGPIMLRVVTGSRFCVALTRGPCAHKSSVITSIALSDDQLHEERLVAAAEAERARVKAAHALLSEDEKEELGIVEDVSACSDTDSEPDLLAGLTKSHNPKHLKPGLVQLADAGDLLRVTVQVRVYVCACVSE